MKKIKMKEQKRSSRNKKTLKQKNREKRKHLKEPH